VGLRYRQSLTLGYSSPTHSGLILPMIDKEIPGGATTQSLASGIVHAAFICALDRWRQLHPSNLQSEMPTACGSVMKPQSILGFVSSGLVPEKYETSPGITLIFGLSSS